MAINKKNVKSILPLTDLQEGLLFHYLKDSKNTFYVEQIVLSINGDFNQDICKNAWQLVVDTNECLRTSFFWEKLSKPLQIVLLKNELDFKFHDFSDKKNDAQKICFNNLIDKDRNQNFNIIHVPFRINLVKHNKTQYSLIVTNHHILYDGWSNGIILKEFISNYLSLSKDLSLVSSIKVPYSKSIKDFIDLSAKADGNFWKKYLEDQEAQNVYLPQNNLIVKDENYLSELKLRSNLVDKINTCCKSHNITKAAFFHACYGILLFKYNLRNDICFGSAISCRDQLLKGIENVVGLFMNTLPFRINIDKSNTLKDYLIDIQDTLQNINDNKHVTLKRIKNTILKSDEDLFNTILAIDNYPVDLNYITKNQSFTIDSFENFETTNYDLSLNIVIHDDNIVVKFNYNNRFDSEFIRMISSHFEQLIEFVSENSDQTISKLEILGKEEKEKILYQFNDTSADFPRDKTINQLFKDTAKKYFNKTAIYCNEKEITYSRLDKMSDQLAVQLIQNGVAQDNIVALLVDRSEYMIVGIMAIIKSGAAYLPLDISLPSQRIDHILEKSKVTVALTNDYNISDKSIKTIDVKNENIYNREAYNLPEVSNSQRLLYVIFTSGSTGDPKGVMIEHRAMVNFILSMNKLIRTTNDDVFLLLTTISFDISGLEIHAPLLSGGQVVIARNEEQLDPRLMFELIEDKGVSVLQVTPSRLKEIIDLENSWVVLNKLKSLLVGGEEFPVSLYNKIINSFSGNLLNCYGPTETTIWSTVKELKPNTQLNIGIPIKNTQVYILSESAELLPIGVIGELCLSGDGLARGYFNDEVLSNDKFIPHPFLSGARLYKTGDLARWTLSGEIEFLGRKDNQVKIRGFRIETGDIECQLLKLNEIAEAVVIALEDDKEEKFLCAYVVTDDSLFELNESEIKEKLAKVLPDYMIPSYIEQIEKIPISNSGKIDRRALPKPAFKILDNFEDPVGSTELALFQIWQNVLGLENKAISRNISFFDIGGHSLKVISLVSLIHKVFEVKLDVNDIFRTKTIKEQANLISLSKTNLYYSIKKAEKKDFYDLSSNQKRLFVLQKMDDDSVVYNMPGILRLSKKLSKKEVSKIFNILILRHESFRTSFKVINETPVQLIHKQVDLKIEEFIIEKEELQDLRKQFIQVFDLSQAPLLRVAIVEVKGDGYLLMIDMHHIISDGVSHSILEREFHGLCSGEDLSELSLQYKDYSQWQNSEEQQIKVKDQENYWIRKFEGEIPVLDLPVDYIRPVIQSHEGARVHFALSKEETHFIKSFAKENGLTLYMSVLSIFNILLSKLSGQEDIIIGTPIAGRNHLDLENVVGMFVNTLAIRNEVNGSISIQEFIRKLKQTTLEAFENQDYQFEDLVENISIERDIGRNPLFDVMFNLLNQVEHMADLTNLDNQNYIHTPGISKFDLTLTAEDYGDKLMLNFEYCTQLFKAETIDRFIVYFKQIVSQIAQNPERELSELEIISAEEKQQILYAFNDTQVSYPSQKSISQVFDEQVKEFSKRIALEVEDKSYTYQDLDEESNKIANYLIKCGVTEDQLVGLMAGRSSDMIIGILGILKTGGAYVPIDPAYPEERVNQLIEDSGINIILSTEVIDSEYDFAGDIININDLEIKESSTNLNLPSITSSNIAYVMYTSGSTGKPKGVVIEQKSVLRLVQNNQFFPFHSEQKILLTGASVFDATTFEIWGALLNGGSLYIASNEVIINSALLGEYIRKNSITSLWLTSSLFNQLVDQEESIFDTLKFLLVGGDVLSVKHINKIKTRNSELVIINGYGPTENTTFSTTFKIEKEYESNIPIGKPISNSTAYIFDKSNRLQVVGVPGELLVGGDGLAREYLNNPELTREKFIENPYKKGERLYKTGDLARWLPDGNIEFIGRIDHQVKIRGFRIELGEIENVLLKHSSIKECVVLAREENGDKYLCAYLVIEEDYNVEEIRSYLSVSIPDYMIPSYFVELDKIPLTSNGKVNRKALPSPEIKAGDDYVAPSNETEEKLVEIWSAVLNIEKEEISTTANFFSIGGHSLKASVLIGRIHKEIDVEFPLRDVFLHSSIKAQAVQILTSKKKEFVSIPKAKEQSDYPLSSAQKRLYLLQEFDLTSTAYNMPNIISLGKEADKSKIEEVFKQLINRHESFRTSINIVDQEPVQIINKEVDFELEELSIENKEVENIRNKFIRPFDLSKAPFLRVAILNIKGEDSLLMIDLHHIISDGISQAILEKEFLALLSGEELAPLALQYRDYSQWQNSKNQQEKIKDQQDYWLSRFEGEIPILNLPTDYIRPSYLSNEGNMITVTLSPKQTRFVRSLCKETGTTLYMSMLSIFSVLLSKLSGQDGFIVGMSVAGRKHPDLQKIVGMFVNSLALDVNPNKNKSFKEFLFNIKSTTLNAYENQDYQFDDLVNKLNIERVSGRNPVFDVMLNMIDASGDKEFQFSNKEEYQFTENVGRRFDLTLNVTNSKNEIILGFQYYPKIFKPETIIRFAQYFKNIITLLEGDSNRKISEIGLLTKAEKQVIQNKLGEKVNIGRSKLPISFHQERIWFIDKFEKNNLYKSSPIYHNIPLVLGIEGKADLILLEKSIQYIISRHDILRSKFYIEEEKFYHDILDKGEITLEEVFTTESKKDDAVNSIIYAPFDLERDLLLRAALITIPEKEQALVLVVHHIISDRYSLKLIAKEILEYYHALRTNKPLVQATVPIRFIDYIYWQRESYSKIKEHLLSYWKPQLKGRVQVIEMPEDTKRVAIHIFKAGEYTFDLPEQLTKSLYEYASTHNFSIDVILLGFYKLLLGRYTNQEEIVVGTNVEGRDNDLTKHLVGPISNLIVLRSFIDFEEDFITYISKLNKTIKEALEYKEIPFDQLVSEINPENDMSRTALFDFLFQYEEIEPDCEIGVNHISSNLGLGKYDQNLLFQNNGNGLRALLVYNTEYYRKESILAFFDHYIQLITNTLKKSDQKLYDIEILSKEEKHQLLTEFNDTKADYPKDKTIHQLFEEQVKRTPENIAISNNGNRLTYSELNKKANLVAQQLREIGIDRDDIVSIFLDRSIETVFSMLGVLKSGGAYLPLDPDYPDDRIDFILNDSRSKIVISTKNFSERIKFEGSIICVEDLSDLGNNISNIEMINKPSDLCYIIYTSGTTGMPKGAMIVHRNAVRLFFNEKFQFDFSEKDVWTMFHSHCFDFSVWEMYGALLYGGKLIVIPKIVARDVVEYYKLLCEEKVTVLNQTPLAFYNLSEIALQDPDKSLENLRYVIFGGEALIPNKLAEWFNIYSNVKLINMYGITETTVHVTYKEISDYEIKNNISNIGKPIPTLTCYILDLNQKLVPIGVSGEICVGGLGVCKGYLYREELTKEKFILNPYKSEERIYRSGDLGRLLPNGDLEYLGRIDHQVKIRGFRIELGEIENQLLSIDQVSEAVVIDREDNSGERSLWGYVVENQKIEITEIRSLISKNLPDYMIPSYFVKVDKIPLTVNGKTDRVELSKFEVEVEVEDHYIAPRNELEEIITGVWKSVLGDIKIGINNDFFQMGGNSIKSIQISSRLRNLGYKISVQEIFSNPTIREMAEVFNNTGDSSQYKLKDEIGLSPIQNRYFTNNDGLNQFNQVRSLEFPNSISKQLLEVIFIEIINHFDSLRIRIDNSEKGSRVQRLTDKITRFNIIEKRTVKTEALNEKLKEIENELKIRIDINNDPIQVVLLHTDVSSYILIGVHYLLIDEYSWKIIFSSISDLYSKSLKNNKLVLSSKYESSINRIIDFENYMGSDRFKETKKYWDKYFNKFKDYYVSARSDKKDIMSESGFLSITIDEQQTKALHNKTNLYFNTKTSDILLSALLLRFKNELNWDKIAIDLESDGRQELYFDKLICNEVGRFSSIYPQIINISTTDEELGYFIKNIKESLNTVPNGGFDYLAYKYLNSGELINYEITDTIPFISYKHLSLDKEDRHNYLFKVLNERYYVNTIPEKNQRYLLEIISYYEDDKLKLDLFFDKQKIPKEFINKLEHRFKKELDNLTKYCIALNKQEKTPSDYTYKKLSFVELKKLNDKYDFLDIYPLSPLQEGMYYHYLLNPKTLSFLPQLRFRLKGNLKEDILRESLNELLSHYDILRTIFVHKELDQPLQIVLNEKEMPFIFKDIRLECKNSDKASVLNKYKEIDRNKLFDLSKDILIRITVLQIEENEYEFIFTYHHILIDGWCLNIITNKFFELYFKNANLNIQSTSTAGQYVNYINWLASKNKERTKLYWQEYLKEYNNLSTIPIEKNESNGLFKYEIIKLDLNQIIVEKCELLAQSYGITTSTIFSGVWGLMLSFYNNISDVVFGLVVSGRSSEISGVENILGLFMNTIPVRVKYDENKSFKDLLVELHNNIGNGESHHFYSLADIKNNLSSKGELLDHYIVYQNVPISERDYADSKNDSNSLKISDVRNNAHTNYDFGINILPGKETIIEFKFNSAVYNSDDIKMISNHFNKLFYNTISESSNKISEIKENLESEFSADFKRYRKTEEIDFVNKTIVNSNRSSSERESLDFWDELS
ncbi:MAG: amino acid adenylation domain-containing protein [Bacteroidales bacterium]|nr:amino acid adenylation domain-containing protein [Bacteroidales bacterium]